MIFNVANDKEDQSRTSYIHGKVILKASAVLYTAICLLPVSSVTVSSVTLFSCQLITHRRANMFGMRMVFACQMTEVCS